jgi:hypothetical protein
MSPTGREALALADFDAQAGALAEQLHALRSEIDTALTKLAGGAGASGTVDARAPMPGMPQTAEARASCLGDGPAEPLDELGVIGCLLGLRPPL